MKEIFNQSSEKAPPSPTKLDFGYSFPHRGMWYKSEGFSFEENKKLLELLVTRKRIYFYTVCVTLLVFLATFTGKDAMAIITDLFLPR